MIARQEARQTGELEPLGTEEEFVTLIDELVAEDAPRVFALVEECGERVDARILAWGMAFEDHAEVVGVYRGVYGRFRSAENARRTFARRRTVRLVWATPERFPVQSSDAASPPLG